MADMTSKDKILIMTCKLNSFVSIILVYENNIVVLINIIIIKNCDVATN